jgi:ATP-dependent protease ClpP protease subunit
MRKVLCIVCLLFLFLVSCNVQLKENTETTTTIAFSTITVVSIDDVVSLDWLPLLEDAFAKPGCAVLAVINSPGGSVTETKLVAHGIEQLKKKYRKAFYVYTDNGIYSGAYWISTIAEKIICAPSAMTGSIGVFAVYVDFSKAASKAGVTYNLFTSGKNKAAGFPYVPLEQCQKDRIQYEIDIFYKEFLNQILATRGKVIVTQITKYFGYTPTAEQLLAQMTDFCDGRELFPEEALNYGLIDNIAWYEDVISYLQTFYPNAFFKALDGSNAKFKIPKAIKMTHTFQRLEMYYFLKL